MEVEVRVFGLAAKSLGYNRKKLCLRESTTVGELLRTLSFPISERWLIIAVNGRKAPKRQQVQDQDVITIHPVCGGG